MNVLFRVCLFAPAELGEKFATSREIEPVCRSFRGRRSCASTEVARLVPSGPVLLLTTTTTTTTTTNNNNNNNNRARVCLRRPPASESRPLTNGALGATCIVHDMIVYVNVLYKQISQYMTLNNVSYINSSLRPRQCCSTHVPVGKRRQGLSRAVHT